MDDIDVDCDETTVGQPAARLPLLTLEEAQEMLGILSAVLEDGKPDKETARWLLGNLAARVPSEEPAAEPRRASARGLAIARALGEPVRRPLRNPDAR
ncbi:hypothetical protein [Streptomyces sp. NBC_00356]|uniref:hypothetical protein n=1 Tax=Streptomyces sp. NBC_00356 TaxID=2975724 RepID=UPI002E25D8E0